MGAALTEAWVPAAAHEPERVEELVALGDGLIAGPEGLRGARRVQPRPSAARRSTCWASKRQLVFATFSTSHVLRRRRSIPSLAYATARAHNRAHGRVLRRRRAPDRRAAPRPSTTPTAPSPSSTASSSSGLGAVWVPHRPGRRPLARPRRPRPVLGPAGRGRHPRRAARRRRPAADRAGVDEHRPRRSPPTGWAAARTCAART